MSTYVKSQTFCGDTVTVENYREFEATDAPTIEAAMLDKFGSIEACREEMLYLTIVAAVRNDRTTLNALQCLRKYWRKGCQRVPDVGERPVK